MRSHRLGTFGAVKGSLAMFRNQKTLLRRANLILGAADDDGDHDGDENYDGDADYDLDQDYEC